MCVKYQMQERTKAAKREAKPHLEQGSSEHTELLHSCPNIVPVLAPVKKHAPPWTINSLLLLARAHLQASAEAYCLDRSR